jgi:hypothetical protein
MPTLYYILADSRQAINILGLYFGSVKEKSKKAAKKSSEQSFSEQ